MTGVEHAAGAMKALGAIAGLKPIERIRRYISSWRRVPGDRVPFRRQILLSEASSKAYDAVVDREYGEAARILSGDPVSYLTTALSMPHVVEDPKLPGPLKLYGRRRGSTRMIQVPDDERRSLIVLDHGQTAKEPGETLPGWTDLTILRHEMRTRIRYLKNFKA